MVVVVQVGSVDHILPLMAVVQVGSVAFFLTFFDTGYTIHIFLYFYFNFFNYSADSAYIPRPLNTTSLRFYSSCQNSDVIFLNQHTTL